MVCRTSTLAALASVVATVAANVPGTFQTAIYNNCTDQPINVWKVQVPEEEGAGGDGRKVLAHGLTIMNEKMDFEWIPMFYASTSEKGYQDHNTKLFIAGFNSKPTHGGVHTNGLDVFGKSNWMSSVAAASEVRCGDNEPPQKWQYASDQYYEAKGMLECRNGNLTAYSAGVAFGFCVKEEDFKFDDNLRLLVDGKDVGFSAL